MEFEPENLRGVYLDLCIHSIFIIAYHVDVETTSLMNIVLNTSYLSHG